MYISQACVAVTTYIGFKLMTQYNYHSFISSSFRILLVATIAIHYSYTYNSVFVYD